MQCFHGVLYLRKCYKWVTIAHWLVVARLNDDIIIFFDIDKNLQGLKMRVCAKFGGSKSVWGHT